MVRTPKRGSLSSSCVLSHFFFFLQLLSGVLHGTDHAMAVVGSGAAGPVRKEGRRCVRPYACRGTVPWARVVSPDAPVSPSAPLRFVILRACHLDPFL